MGNRGFLRWEKCQHICLLTEMTFKKMKQMIQVSLRPWVKQCLWVHERWMVPSGREKGLALNRNLEFTWSDRHTGRQSTGAEAA